MNNLPIPRITAFGDLNCPFCFTLNEWIDELGYGSLVDFWSIEHLPGLTPQTSSTKEEIAKMKSECDRAIEKTGGKPKLILPPQRPNSALVMATLIRIAATDPDRVAEARKLLYRALWHHGFDFSKPEVIKEQLHDFDLGDLNEMEAELAVVSERTANWKIFDIELIPAIAAPTGAKYVGLGTKKALKVFLGSALFSSEREGGCKT